MSDDLSGLKPQPLWKYFEEICRIPHGSGHEKALAVFVLACAQSRKFAAQTDAAGNVFLPIPASPLKVSSPGIILPVHLDLVW